jgi:AcrR family transcriptional regulator
MDSQPIEDADLTARARIRNAALDLFIVRGLDGASIREVARKAHVSPGLVQHHFGTKDGLRAACDEYVLAQLMDIKEQLMAEGRVENPAFLAASHPEVLRLYRYLARSVVEGRAGAEAIFDQMVAITEEWLETHHPDIAEDIHAYAALLVTMETGVLAMHHQLSRALGADVLSPAGHLRLAKAKLDFYSTPLATKEFADQARRSIDTLLKQQDRAGKRRRA